VVSVLSGAPYGYRYVRKTDTSAAYYEVLEAEAQVVRWVFETYTQRAISINALARLLNERQIPTRTAKTRWERSTVWGMLRNPAYQGTACYGKTELRPRQRITRPLRQRQGIASRDSANHERPRGDWIKVPVPPLLSEEMFALAQEQLEQNKHHSPRRTIEATLLQGCWYVNNVAMLCTGVRRAPVQQHSNGRIFKPRNGPIIGEVSWSSFFYFRPVAKLGGAQNGVIIMITPPPITIQLKPRKVSLKIAVLK
jgi:hypothetical protein